MVCSVFSTKDVIASNAFWLAAHIGTGYYFYSREHMKSVDPVWRVAYSCSGALLFNFGTVLVWATTKMLLPNNDAVRMLFGITSGMAFLEVARRYLSYVDCSFSDVPK